MAGQIPPPPLEGFSSRAVADTGGGVGVPLNLVVFGIEELVKCVPKMEWNSGAELLEEYPCFKLNDPNVFASPFFRRRQ